MVVQLVSFPLHTYICWLICKCNYFIQFKLKLTNWKQKQQNEKPVLLFQSCSFCRTVAWFVLFFCATLANWLFWLRWIFRLYSFCIRLFKTFQMLEVLLNEVIVILCDNIYLIWLVEELHGIRKCIFLKSPYTMIDVAQHQ